MNVSTVKNPLVSIYWVSAYRSDYLLNSVNSFFENTNYKNIEIIVVDCSVGKRGYEHRTAIKKSNIFDKILFRDSIFCLNNNANYAFESCKGDFIIQFEDDIRFKVNTDKDWLYKCVSEIQSGEFDCIDLFSDSDIHSGAGSITSRKARRELHPYACYPSDFETVTESMKSAHGKLRDKFRRTNLKLKSNKIIETSMKAPSINFSKIPKLLNISLSNFKKIDGLVDNGYSVYRDKKTEYVDFDTYKEKGTWKTQNHQINSYSKQTFYGLTIKVKLMQQKIFKKLKNFINFFLRKSNSKN